jgi:hypothetical protein
MEIHDSARAHGIADDDIRHAVANHLYARGLPPEEPPARVLYLGPDHAGNLLEVVVIERVDASEIAIHAMKMRKKYESFISGRET